MTAPRIFTPEYYARMRDLEQAGGWNAAMRAVETRCVHRPGGILLVRGILFVRSNAQALPYTEDHPAADFHRCRLRELRDSLSRTGFIVLCPSHLNGLLRLAQVPVRCGHRAAGTAPATHGIMAEPRESPFGRALKIGRLRVEGGTRSDARAPTGGPDDRRGLPRRMTFCGKETP